ncbi:conserved exported hypothetical protein [Pseudoalteromonas sp. 3J6]|uniref:hypothetical protein n=1 Tax=Pseudoalteromonas sp. 3J6 TaxID=649161 RepID=UPI001760D37B|nr:hypothetical protein [Pseudoalteromonas sp. 3J6]CAD2225845.1 conserved exported hypothetical protein [Pseudoalteromonas sp. 3J6]
MNILLAISMTAATLGLTGCLAQSSEPTPKLQHALLIEPNSAKVADAIAQLLHSSQVQLADDVFVTSSTVTLERLNHKDPQGNPIMGKQLNMPDQFELMIKGKQCFIRHLDSKATEPLPGVSCKAIY